MGRSALTSNRVYALNQAILTHLKPVLEAEIGQPFLDYCAQWDILAAKAWEDTYRLGMRLAANSPALDSISQEELLATSDFYPRMNLAWKSLMDIVTDTQRTLCKIYQTIWLEQQDIISMAVALQSAQTNGSAEYAQRVKEVLDLEGVVAPGWWPGN